MQHIKAPEGWMVLMNYVQKHALSYNLVYSRLQRGHIPWKRMDCHVIVPESLNPEQFREALPNYRRGKKKAPPGVSGALEFGGLEA